MFKFFQNKKREKNQNSILIEECQRLKEELKSSNIQLEQSRDIIQELEANLADLHEKNRIVRGSGYRKVLEGCISDRDQQICELKEKLQTLSEKMKGLRTKDRLNSDINESLRDKNRVLREKNSHLKEVNQNSSNRIKELKKDREVFLVEQLHHLEIQNKELQRKLIHIRQSFNDKLLEETIQLRKKSMTKVVNLIKTYHRLNIQSLTAELKTLRKSKAAFLQEVSANGYHLAEINRLNKHINRLEEKYETLVFHFGSAGFFEHREKTDNLENLFGMSAHKEAMKFAYLIEANLKRMS